jgi:hypothetical protein
VHHDEDADNAGAKVFFILNVISLPERIGTKKMAWACLDSETKT